MQPQPEISKSKHKTKTSNNQLHQQHQLPTTATATTLLQHRRQRSPSVKVIKCKKPLCHFKFYLDIQDHQLTKHIEEQIKSLGGALEFFLTPTVTHFVTDKTVLPSSVGTAQRDHTSHNNSNKCPNTAQSPATPVTPPTPRSVESYDGKTNNGYPIATRRSTRQSRADAILNRARRQSTTANATGAGPTLQLSTPLKYEDCEKVPPYIIWQTEQALRFFKKVQYELKNYLDQPRKSCSKSYSIEPINLKGGFIKIETLKRNYRPYYQLFRKPNEWPKIELSREDGAFRLSPKKQLEIGKERIKVRADGGKANMTRKSRSRSSQAQRAALPTNVKTLNKGGINVAKSTPASTGQHATGPGGCKQQIKESSDKQYGVCEICKIEYDTLTIHLKTKDHEFFAKNSQNFIALDTLIHASADVNKFLNDNKKLGIKNKLEKMEVDGGDAADAVAAKIHEPLDAVTYAKRSTMKRMSSGGGSTQKLISPTTLREKSKRSTKGKHSSEKFQNSPAASKSPKTPSPQKMIANTAQQQPTTSSMVELQHINTTSTTTTRKKPSIVHSPPIRAMLPPSSLYKVVEAQTDTRCTPSRGRGGTTARDDSTLASPSIIVKFKKVRTTELEMLNGEAENFMFPKRRSDSSELPTDMDRQTTSDAMHVSASTCSPSSSLSSSNNSFDCESTADRICAEGNRDCTNAKTKRNISKGRQQMAAPSKQSFPNAPIQSAVQLKGASPVRRRSTATASATATTATAAAILAATTSITLPEATRKSSRTATAIVTAATTSSRLLRAAVEAAKNNSRRLAAATTTSIISTRSTDKEVYAEKSKSVKIEPAQESLGNKTRRYSRRIVVKLEDGMGDNLINIKSNNQKEEDSEESEEDIHEDDDKDEDYIQGKRNSTKRPRPFISEYATKPATTSREERAARRQSRMLQINLEPQSDEDHSVKEPEDEEATGKKAKQRTSQRNSKNVKLKSTPSKKKTPPQRLFDYAKSERLRKLRYAFERVPATDLWYRVYSRQDNCEECYFEYYGSTNYRKLPYELGPTPFECALVGSSNCCKLCNASVNHEPAASGASGEENMNVKKKEVKEEKAQLQQQEFANKSNNILNSVSERKDTNTSSCVSTKYAHKHKKLHLLQRYRQEQEEMHRQRAESQIEKCLSANNIADVKRSNANSKASTPERTVACPRGRTDSASHERIESISRERAGSTHSNASSISSTATTDTKNRYRNKHLNKAAFLAHLELPPRKSPREHASTLALVSCIIKQRQDSLSKPNSETDEPPPPTLTPNIPENSKPSLPVLNPEASVSPLMPVQTLDEVAVHSPRSTHSVRTTPVEELRFATEISETVKRMRRGRNKYDHSPPYVARSARRPRSSHGRGSVINTSVSSWGRNLHTTNQRHQTLGTRNQMITHARRRRGRQKCSAVVLEKSLSGQPSIRKTGSKKGVLEFEVDAEALKALDPSTQQQHSVRLLEWQIDKYLQMSGKNFDPDFEVDAIGSNTDSSTIPSVMKMSDPMLLNEIDTPPPTDCFSSDFDLYDLLTQNTYTEEDHCNEGKRKDLNMFNPAALHNYFRRRKNLKMNRTGWPKAAKKKLSTRQQQLMQEKIYFLANKDIDGKRSGMEEAQSIIKQEPLSVCGDDDLNGDDCDEGNEKNKNRENGVITPPDSDDVEMDGVKQENEKYEEEENAAVNEGMKLGCGEEDVPIAVGKSSIDDEYDADTLADSNEEPIKAESDADADVEEADNDEDYEEEEEEDIEDVQREEGSEENIEAVTTECNNAYNDDDNEDYNFEPMQKRIRCCESLSPTKRLPNSLMLGDNVGHSAVATSTPTTQMLRGLRRTPQLNGSLGSCVSPSEKAGDNSDIFTVSSDGLDTDLDLSNSHSQMKGQNDEDNYHHHHNHHYHHQHDYANQMTTPKRKFDLSKYAPTNAASCAAEAATAAVKSLAISQFLKKEVRVTCRRLRAPFRRFRYRR